MVAQVFWLFVWNIREISISSLYHFVQTYLLPHPKINICHSKTKPHHSHGIHYIKIFPITDKYVQSYLISDPFDLMVKNIIDNNESEIIQACQDYLFECENGNKHFMTPDIDGIIKMLDMLDENKDTN